MPDALTAPLRTPAVHVAESGVTYLTELRLLYHGWYLTVRDPRSRRIVWQERQAPVPPAHKLTFRVRLRFARANRAARRRLRAGMRAMRAAGLDVIALHSPEFVVRWAKPSTLAVRAWPRRDDVVTVSGGTYDSRYGVVSRFP